MRDTTEMYVKMLHVAYIRKAQRIPGLRWEQSCQYYTAQSSAICRSLLLWLPRNSPHPQVMLTSIMTRRSESPRGVLVGCEPGISQGPAGSSSASGGTAGRRRRQRQSTRLDVGYPMVSSRSSSPHYQSLPAGSSTLRAPLPHARLIEPWDSSR
eukprot:6031473-Amphidinium_carterae.3